MTSRLLLGAVGLVRGTVEGIGPAMASVRDTVERHLDESGWFSSVPFETISLVIRYGSEGGPEVEINWFDEQYDELPVIVQVSLDSLKDAAQDSNELRNRVLGITVAALRSIAAEFGLSDEWLRQIDGTAGAA